MIEGQTPSKSFEVAIECNGVGEVIEYGSDLSSILVDYRNALVAAKKATKKDKANRIVSLRQVLLYEVIA